MLRTLRPTDLAREHGISTQAVRNYERDNCLPAADRTAAGYRVYTELHAAALRAHLALIRGVGHAVARGIMQAVHRGRVDDALAMIDAAHDQLRQDRDTLATVRDALDHLSTTNAQATDADSVSAESASPIRTPTSSTTAEPQPSLVQGDRQAEAVGAAQVASADVAWSIGELAHAVQVSPATLRTWERAGILVPCRDDATGYRVFGSTDIRDARLAHLLRRGGYLTDQIATVMQQLRTAGDAAALAATVDDWQGRVTGRGLAMLTAAGQLGDYLNQLPARILTPNTSAEV